MQPEKKRLPEIRAGTLEVKLARTENEIYEAQALRYRVFVEEMGAHPSAEEAAVKRDFDIFDAYCDHMLVLEHASGKAKVVGTYRLLRRSAMQLLGKFYTQTEFDISAVLEAKGEILELGRSCVQREYRNRAVMQLLWRGIGVYVDYYNIELLFGCGSLHGAQLEQHKETLSYLYYYHLAPVDLRMKALPELYQRMDYVEKNAIHVKETFAALPALIKGYLRLGGYVGDGAVIDAEYNTTDVGIIVKTELVTERYAQRYANAAAKEGV